VKRVGVTGGGGFIGQAVNRELIRQGFEPVTLDMPKHDVRTITSLDVDAVINLAGVLGTEETLGAEAHAVEVNILGALRIYDLAAERDIPVVQIGTGHKGQPNPYAITKGAAEDIGLARARFRGEKIVVVRAFHAYGPAQKMSPPHGTATVRKIIPSFVCRALTDMDVEVNGSGQQAVDLVHVNDVAATLAEAIDGPYGMVIEAGTGKPTTVLDAARDIIAATSSASQIVHRPMRAGEPEYSSVVAESPTCPNPWPYRLDETIDWYRGKL